MRSGAWLRRGFYLFVTLLFGGALLGMLVTGPVVVRVPRIDHDVEASPERLRATVERLCSEFAPRDFRHPAKLDAAAAWIGGEFRAAGLEVEFQDYEVDGTRYRNVIGRRVGTKASRGIFVLGAHYDAVEGSPGADDNASGVATLLELVRTLPEIPTERTHYFVAFSTEEPPFFGTNGMGSHHFAEKLQRDGVEVSLMVSLDLVGYYSDQAGSQRFPSPLFRLLYPSRGDFVAIIGDTASGDAIDRVKRGLMAAGELPVHSFRAPASSGLVERSDHLSFRRHGMPAVQITDTAFLRYEHDHGPEDLPGKLDYARMADLVHGLHGILWEGD